jgi:plastocyanin
MRLLLAALTGFALAVVPALAADHTVTASDFQFTPKDVTVAPGDTVHWTGGGIHTVHFDDQAQGTPVTASPTRKFDAAGTYLYYCDPHGGPGGQGMSGRVIVKAPDTTTQTTTSTTTTENTPTTTTTAPTQTTTTQTSAPVIKPAVTVKTVGRTFRTRTGIRLRISSDRARTLTGTFRRSGRTVGSLRLAVKKGTRVYRVRRTRSRRLLGRGSYSLTLRSGGAYGLPVTVKFRVR